MSGPEPSLSSPATSDEQAFQCKPPSRRGLVLGLVTALSGVGLLAILSNIEEKRLETQELRDAVFAVSENPPWEGMVPVAIRELPEENFADGFVAWLQLEEDEVDLLEELRLDTRERVAVLPWRDGQWERILATGRAPAPGTREVVAGDLCRLDSFTMDGETFTVVGRIQRGVSGMVLTYGLPDAESIRRHFSNETGARKAWFDPAGLDWAEEAAAQETFRGMSFVGGHTRTDTALAAASIAGMVLTMLGGVLVWFFCFGWLRNHVSRDAGAVFREMEEFRRVFWGLHLVMYGAFFASMAAALLLPFPNLAIMLCARDVFTGGRLSFIGEAYQSKDVLRAAGITWFWNYGVATLVLSILPSFIIPFAGLLKNLSSFVMVGFAMSPVWTGSASGMVYHSGTMVLELEAYVVASFAATMYPVLLVIGIVKGRFRHYAARAFGAMASAALVTGVMLGVAALYEAVTLIAFHFS